MLHLHTPPPSRPDSNPSQIATGKFTVKCLYGLQKNFNQNAGRTRSKLPGF
jgi:hypothetical protein